MSPTSPHKEQKNEITSNLYHLCRLGATKKCEKYVEGPAGKHTAEPKVKFSKHDPFLTH